MKKFFNSNLFYSLLALLCAILLSIYTRSTRVGFVTQGQRSQTTQTATKEQSMKVPLQVSVDTDKYYVVGYPEKVRIHLSGPSALVTSTVNTQNFRVFIDLTKLSVGKHRVSLKVSGLSKQISYSLQPSSVTVNIQKKKSRSLPVQIEYNKNTVATGYHFGTATSDPRIVSVTGSGSEINQLNRVVAKVSLAKGVDKTVEQQVILVAEDKKGHQLNVVIDPATSSIRIPVELSSKKVKIKLNTRNEASGKIYSVTASRNYVTIYGSKKVLSHLSQIPVDVNLSGVKNNTTRQARVQLPKGVVKAKPATIKVKIKVGASPAKDE
ncbi:MAG: CdaR family protein [Lactobacillus sp.]|jgi:YbbR domain-containing protein|nr:CdaR family protein [Lactobacillus sp.]